MAAEGMVLERAKIAKVPAVRMPKAGVAAQILARPKMAVANQPNHHHQASSHHLREVAVLGSRAQQTAALDLGLVGWVAVAVVQAALLALEVREAQEQGQTGLQDHMGREARVEAAKMEATATELVRAARKILSCWEEQLTALIWEDWSSN
jgi:hypothetical protein